MGGPSDEKIGVCDALTSYARPARSSMIVIAKGTSNGLEIRVLSLGQMRAPSRFLFRPSIRRGSKMMHGGRGSEACLMGVFSRLARCWLIFATVLRVSVLAENPQPFQKFLDPLARHALGCREKTSGEVSDKFNTLWLHTKRETWGGCEMAVRYQRGL